nr:NAD(P)-dependent oxidoreductase [Gloeobacter morelensis]
MSGGTRRRNVFVTGASGCVGQYLLDILIEDDRYHSYLLLREPLKLKSSVRAHPNVTIIPGTLADLDLYRPYLEQSDYLIHMATSWGGADAAYAVNFVQTLQLLGAVNHERCRKVLYFSTSSILDNDNRPLEFAKREGTDYIRTKYLCHERLPELGVYDRIVSLFPTLIMAAGKDKPVSHVSSGIPKVAPWLGVARFFKTDASFHFIHAHDVALVTHHLLAHDTESNELVLGNPAITVNECLEQLCAFFGNKRVFGRFEMTVGIMEWIIKVFHIQMSPWDYYYIKQRHFNYKCVVNPATFGLSTPFSTLAGILAE